MIFDNQSEIVEVFRKKGIHFEVLSTKYMNFNNFRQILEFFFTKFLFFGNFLEFFILGNNHTLQDPLYTRSITLILCRERNKKIRFHIKSFANRLETCKLDLYKSDTFKQLLQHLYLESRDDILI